MQVARWLALSAVAVGLLTAAAPPSRAAGWVTFGPGFGLPFGSYGGWGLPLGFSPGYSAAPLGWGGWLNPTPLPQLRGGPPLFAGPGYFSPIPPTAVYVDPVRVWPWVLPYGGGTNIATTTQIILNGGGSGPAPAPEPPAAEPAPAPVAKRGAAPLQPGERFYLELPAKPAPEERVRQRLRVSQAEPRVYLVRWTGPEEAVAAVELRALTDKGVILETRRLAEAPFRVLFRVPEGTTSVSVRVEERGAPPVTLTLPLAEFRSLEK